MKAPIDPPFNVTESLDKYPKILHYGPEHGGLNCIAFEKYDGSNLAWRWDGAGFGPATLRSGRTIMFEKWAMTNGVGVHLPNDLHKILSNLLTSLSAEEAVFFTEFRGEKSFSGEHVEGDPKTLHPIDLWIKGWGFMPPHEFTEHFPVEPVYRGKLTTKFVEDVRKGRLGVNEGVVCKGGKWGSVWSCKIKTDAWLAKGGEL